LSAQPQSASRYEGGSVSFAVEATGKRPLTYLWRHDGTPLPNSNTNRLVVTNLAAADAGAYTVIVTNDLGTDTSMAATSRCQQITNVATGLVGYWTFDETEGSILYDTSGHGHNGALQNFAASPGNVGW